MKIRKRLPVLITLLLLALLIPFTSCKKKEIPGPKGEPGAPGGGGDASITSTTVFAVASSQWSADTVNNYMKATIALPQITADIISKGAVKAYLQMPAPFTGTAWTELPYVKGDLFTQFGFEAGRLYLTYINIEGGMPAAPPDANYRVVIISHNP